MISDGVETTIDEIQRLADGLTDDQIKACKKLKELFPGGKLKNRINTSVIPQLLPIIVTFLKSESDVLQLEAAYFIDAFVCTSDRKENTLLVIEHYAIDPLVKLLSSTTPNVIIASLKALGQIAYEFPEEFMQEDYLPLFITYLDSPNTDISHNAVYLIRNISYCAEMIPAILQSDCVQHLSKLLEANNYHTCRYSVGTLFNLISVNAEYCQGVLGRGVLANLKKLSDRIFITDTKRASKDDKLAVLELLKNIASFGEAQVDLIISEGFIPIILRQVSDKMTAEIKVESIKIARNIITAKPDFLPTLINDYNIIYILYKNLKSKSVTLINTFLNVLKIVIEKFDDEEICRRKIRECDDMRRLEKLLKHSNEEFQRIAQFIHEFVSFEPEASAEISSLEVSEENTENDTSSDLNEVESCSTLENSIQILQPESVSQFVNLQNIDELPSINLQEQERIERIQTPFNQHQQSSNNHQQQQQYNSNNDQEIREITRTPSLNPQHEELIGMRRYHRMRQVMPTRIGGRAETMKITRLPFFDVTAVVLKMSELTPLNGRNGEVRSIFTFQIQPEHISLIRYRGDQPIPRYEVQLRMFQFASDVEQADDFPPNCSIKVNDNSAVLPAIIPKTRRNEVEKRYSRPVDITQCIQSSRVYINEPHEVEIDWDSDRRTWAVGVWLVHRQNASILLERLLSTGIRRSVDETKNKIAVMLAGDDDNIALDQLKISLLCPHSAKFEASQSVHLSRQSPNLPEAAATNDEENFVIETMPSPISLHPIVPADTTAPNANNTAIATTSDDPTSQYPTVPSYPPLPPLQTSPSANDVLSSANSFPPLNYWHPHGRTIYEYCENLGIQFNRKNYAAFIQKIELTEITSNSKPDTFYSPNDRTGFG